MTAKDTALRFVEAINSHDVEIILQLMSEDHLFIDSLGASVRGRDKMPDPWKGYFEMVPDYQITITETFEKGERVAMFGSARGTCAAGGKLLASNRWETPAAWSAVVKSGRVSEWWVYADNEPIRRIMRARHESHGD